MKRIFYLKANREKWHDKLDKSNNNQDWLLAIKNPSYKEGILFSATHKIRDYFEHAQKGDMVILHSTHTVKTRNGEELVSRPKFVPQPRIVGISIINSSMYFDEEYKEDMISVDVKNMHVLPRPVHLKELELKSNPILNTAEPFRSGTNRFVMTSLNDGEYIELKKNILKKNPESKNAIENLEKMRI